MKLESAYGPSPLSPPFLETRMPLGVIYSSRSKSAKPIKLLVLSYYISRFLLYSLLTCLYQKVNSFFGS